jgi:DNA-binding MarR family transcriptional regulator
LTPEQLAVLRFVEREGEVTSVRLTHPPFSLKQSNASNQLVALWRAGLLRRIEGAAASGGREYRYYPIG